MLDEYYDLQKTVSKLIQEHKEETENLNKNLELSLFEIEKPIRKSNNLQKYISNVKKELIKKGYLDYINKENYTLLSEIREEIFNYEFRNSFSLDFNELKKDFLINENLIFHNILKKMRENEYIIFLFNYDFIEKGLQINYQNIKEVYQNTNQKTVNDEELIFNIENIKIKTQDNKDYIEEIHKNYEIYNEKRESYMFDFNNLIKKINNLEVLNTKINIDEILKFDGDFFVKGIKNNKIQLEGILAEFIYKNEIQEFIDNKNDIIQRINIKKNDITDLNKKIINENLDNEYLELKEYNYSVRELSNSYLTNLKEKKLDDDLNKIEDKFHNKNHIEIIKIKNENKKIYLEIEKIKEKQDEILKKMEDYSEDTKRNNIIKNRFQKIIDKYQNEINVFREKIDEHEKIIINKNNLANKTVCLNKKKIGEKKDNIKDLIEKVREEKNKKYINLKNIEKVSINFNLEIKKDIKLLENEVKILEGELKNIKNKYSNKFLIYEDYNNKLKSIDECIKLFTEVKILRDFYFKNLENYKSEIKKFNTNQYNLLNIIQKKKSENFWSKINEGIILIKNLEILIENQRIYNLVDVKLKQEFFYLNLLDYIKSYRHNNYSIDYNFYKSNFYKYNLILYKKIHNINQIENIEHVSIDLKKMIYILQ